MGTPTLRYNALLSSGALRGTLTHLLIKNLARYVCRLYLRFVHCGANIPEVLAASDTGFLPFYSRDAFFRVDQSLLIPSPPADIVSRDTCFGAVRGAPLRGSSPHSAAQMVCAVKVKESTHQRKVGRMNPSSTATTSALVPLLPNVGSLLAMGREGNSISVDGELAALQQGQFRLEGAVALKLDASFCPLSRQVTVTTGPRAKIPDMALSTRFEAEHQHPRGLMAVDLNCELPRFAIIDGSKGHSRLRVSQAAAVEAVMFPIRIEIASVDWASGEAGVTIGSDTVRSITSQDQITVTGNIPHTKQMDGGWLVIRFDPALSATRAAELAVEAAALEEQMRRLFEEGNYR